MKQQRAVVKAKMRKVVRLQKLLIDWWLLVLFVLPGLMLEDIRLKFVSFVSPFFQHNKDKNERSSALYSL